VGLQGATAVLRAKDTKPGDKTGDGFLNNSWHVARPGEDDDRRMPLSLQT
jgi:hypothetical protein